MLFKLTEEHIRNGHLNEEDFGSAVQFPIATFTLSDFPHYAKLAKHQQLSQSEIQERAVAIYRAMQKRKIAEDNEDGDHIIGDDDKFDFIDAMSVAGNAFATIWSHGTGTYSPPYPVKKHYDLIREFGFEGAHRKESPIWHTMNGFRGTVPRKYVIPGILSEDVGITGSLTRYAAFILLDRRISAREHWAKETRIPLALVENHPNDNAHLLKVDVHERRHLSQRNLSSSIFVTDFYAELDAEMAARASLRQANIGATTLQANIHQRYMEMLFTYPKYWFAATLESLEAGETPQDAFKTHLAVNEVRMRLTMKNIGEDSGQLTSHEIQTAIMQWNLKGFTDVPHLPAERVDFLGQKYDERLPSLVSNNPAHFYTDLRHLVERNLFDDPFTLKIAVKILDAATYFNPDLIHADHRPCVKRMKDRLAAPEYR